MYKGQFITMRWPRESAYTPRKLTWPIKKENCTHYLKMAIFPLPSYFTGKESWKYSTIQPILGPPSQWTLLWWFLSKVPSFSSTKNPHFLHNLVLVRWWWLLQLGNHILRCRSIGPGWAANHQGRCGPEPKQPEPQYATFENHGTQKCGKGYVGSQENKMWVGVSACEPLGLWKLW